MRVPKFKNIEEEAEFWDKSDTSEILNTEKRIKIEWDSPGKYPSHSQLKLRLSELQIAFKT